MNYNELIDSLDLDNDSAYKLAVRICKRFDFQYAIITADDVTEALEQRLIEPSGENLDKVMGTYNWRGVGEIMRMYAEEILETTIDTYLVSEGD